MSWRHPRSDHWHQLRLVITRRADLSSFLCTRSYHSADCDMTTRSLQARSARCKQAQKYHPRKDKKVAPGINTCGTSDPVNAQSFADSLQEKLTAQPTTSKPDVKWSHLHDAIYNSGQEEGDAGSQAESFPKHTRRPSSS